MNPFLGGFDGMAFDTVSFLGDATVRATALLSICFLAVVALRSSPSRLRYAIWSSGLAALVIIPLAAPLAPRWEIPVAGPLADLLPTSSHTDVTPTSRASGPHIGVGRERTATDLAANTVLGDAVGKLDATQSDRAEAELWAATTAELSTTSGPGVTAASRTTASLGNSGKGGAWWARIVLAIWGLGTVGLLGRLALGVTRIREIGNRAHDPPRAVTQRWRELERQVLGVSRAELRISSEITTPMTYGHLRPVVLLPRSSPAWPADQLESVLLHELMHIRRSHWAYQIVAYVARAVHWFNPLPWIALNRLTRERECSCDEDVIATGVSRAAYAGHLLQVARERKWDRQMVAALNLTHQSKLEDRVMSILNSDQTPTRGTGALLAVTAMIFFSGIGISGAAFVNASSPFPDIESVTDARLAIDASQDTVVRRVAPPAPISPPRTTGDTPAPVVPPEIVALSEVSDVPAPLVPLELRVPVAAPTEAPAPIAPPRSALQCDDVIDQPEWSSSQTMGRRSGGRLINGMMVSSGDMFIRHEFTDGSCLEALVVGDVDLGPEGTSIERVGPGASVELAGTFDGRSVHVLITRGSQGAPEHTWMVDGRSRSQAENGDEWIATALDLVADLQGHYDSNARSQDRRAVEVEARALEEALERVSEAATRTREIRRISALNEDDVQEIRRQLEEISKERREIVAAFEDRSAALSEFAREMQALERELATTINLRADSLRLGTDTLIRARLREIEQLRVLDAERVRQLQQVIADTLRVRTDSLARSQRELLAAIELREIDAQRVQRIRTEEIADVQREIASRAQQIQDQARRIADARRVEEEALEQAIAAKVARLRNLSARIR